MKLEFDVADSTMCATKRKSVEYVDPAEAVMPQEPPPEPVYKLKFLWLEKNIAVCVDQVLKKDNFSPMTEYFFWPRKDAWEELKEALDAKPWVSERDAVLLLNRTTEVINFWQEEGVKHTLSEAREKFPDCEFIGS